MTNSGDDACDEPNDGAREQERSKVIADEPAEDDRSIEGDQASDEERTEECLAAIRGLAPHTEVGHGLVVELGKGAAIRAHSHTLSCT